MKAKRGKRKAAPAIVPRFLKNAVTIGAIPVIAASCGPSHKRLQPVVAYIGPDEQREALPTPDAGVDAATVQQPPPPPVVAMMMQQPPPPPVVAAMMPNDEPQPTPPKPTPPKNKKRKR